MVTSSEFECVAGLIALILFFNAMEHLTNSRLKQDNIDKQNDV